MLVVTEAHAYYKFSLSRNWQIALQRDCIVLYPYQKVWLIQLSTSLLVLWWLFWNYCYLRLFDGYSCFSRCGFNFCFSSDKLTAFKGILLLFVLMQTLIKCFFLPLADCVSAMFLSWGLPPLPSLFLFWSTGNIIFVNILYYILYLLGIIF